MYCKNCGQPVGPENKFCKACGTEVVRPQPTPVSTEVPKPIKEKKWLKYLAWGAGALALVVIVVGAYMSEDSNALPAPAASEDTDSYVSQNTLTSMVVNILCLDDSEEGGSGGSGTIMTEDGLILTNAHIIPQDYYGNSTSFGCIITLPDPQGKIDSIYLGTPVLIPELSSDYDLAFVRIVAPYENDLGITQGPWPRSFPNFGDTGCANGDPTLGEPVRVFGYPATSGGGYYLTLTSGEVSSLPDDGTIYTSASVNHGSSGGLAVDENGCMIGIPTAISGEDNESLGVIYSNSIIAEFMQALDEDDL